MPKWRIPCLVGVYMRFNGNYKSVNNLLSSLNGYVVRQNDQTCIIRNDLRLISNSVSNLVIKKNGERSKKVNDT